MDDLPRVCEEVGVLVSIAHLFAWKCHGLKGPQQLSWQSESSFTFVHGYDSTRMRASPQDWPTPWQQASTYAQAQVGRE